MKVRTWGRSAIRSFLVLSLLLSGVSATFILDPYGAVTEIKLDVPNDDFWFYELELRKR